MSRRSQTIPLFWRLLENAGDPRMRILDVKNRIFARLSLGKFQIEIEMAVGFAHQEKKSRRVAPDFLQDLFQSNEFAGALAHAYRFAAAGELHHLHQHDVEDSGIVTKPLHRRFQARHIAMVISAPDIDQLFKIALELVAMVCDIGGEIRKLAVAFDQRAVFVVAELRRLDTTPRRPANKSARGHAATDHRSLHFVAALASPFR